MTNMPGGVRVLQFQENWQVIGKDGKPYTPRPILVVVTDDNMAISTAYKIIKARWQEENSGFHEMKTNYHFEHLYSHEG